jgi:predicted kinase
LERLTKQSLELEPSRTETKARACPNFSALQSYARSLFNTLRSGLQCSCDGHAVKLRLENRNQRADNDEKLLEKTQFRVIFTSSSNASAKVSDWREADIRWIADKPRSVALPPCSASMYTATKAARRVRFDPSNGGTTMTVREQQTSIVLSSIPNQISNLCQVVAMLQQRQGDACAGYLLDSFKRKQGIYPLGAPICQDDQQKWSAYTLRQVLTKQAGFSRRLMGQDKFRVAVDLASSVLQLYKTPWLKDDWSNNDVYFVHRPGAPASTIYQHPFIYRKMSSQVAAHSSTTPTPVHRVIRNQTLFTLGVLLIELLYGMSIEELQIARDLECQGTPGVVWCTAERLIDEEIALEAGKLYCDAVRRCIRCDFNRQSSSLDDQDFQQAVYSEVVTPLEKTLQRFNGQD